MEINQLYHEIVPLIIAGHTDKKLLLLENIDLIPLYNETKNVKITRILLSYGLSLIFYRSYDKFMDLINRIDECSLKIILMNQLYIQAKLFDRITLLDHETLEDRFLKLHYIFQEFNYKLQMSNSEDYLFIIEMMMVGNTDELIHHTASIYYMRIFFMQSDTPNKLNFLEAVNDKQSLRYIKEAYDIYSSQRNYKLALELSDQLLKNTYIRSNTLLYQELSLKHDLMTMIYTKTYHRMDFQIEDLYSSPNDLINLILKVQKMYIYNNIGRLLNVCDNEMAQKYITMAFNICKSFDKSVRRSHLTIYTNYYGFTRNHSKCIKFLKLDVAKNKYDFNTIHDLLVCYSNLKDWDNYYRVYCQYEQFLFSHCNHTMINNILYMHCLYINDTNNMDSLNVIENYFNEYENLTPERTNQYLKTFIARLQANKNLITALNYEIIDNYDVQTDIHHIRNEENQIICILCMESINRQNIILINCKTCKKYVGHFTCVSKWLTQCQRCPYCNCA